MHKLFSSMVAGAVLGVAAVAVAGNANLDPSGVKVGALTCDQPVN